MLEELLIIVKDQIEGRSLVVILLSEESAFWKDASMPTLFTKQQMRYRTKSNKVQNVASGIVNIGEFGTFGKRQYLKGIVMDGLNQNWEGWKSWKIGEFPN